MGQSEYSSRIMVAAAYGGLKFTIPSYPGGGLGPACEGEWDTILSFILIKVVITCNESK